MSFCEDVMSDCEDVIYDYEDEIIERESYCEFDWKIFNFDSNSPESKLEFIHCSPTDFWSKLTVTLDTCKMKKSGGIGSGLVMTMEIFYKDLPKPLQCSVEMTVWKNDSSEYKILSGTFLRPQKTPDSDSDTAYYELVEEWSKENWVDLLKNKNSLVDPYDGSIKITCGLTFIPHDESDYESDDEPDDESDDEFDDESDDESDDK